VSKPSDESNRPQTDAEVKPGRPVREPNGSGAGEINERIVDPVEEAMALFESGDRDFIREHLAREVVRLRDVVAEKDAVIWGLNRDLGAYAQVTINDRAGGNPVWDRIGQTVIKLGRKLRILRPSVPAKSIEDTPDEADFMGLPQRDPLIPFGPDNEGKKIIAVTIFGLERDETKKVLKTVTRYCADRDAVPVIMTDSVRTEDLREAGFAFEYVPSAEIRERLAPDNDWPLYLQRRMRLLKRKWAPDGFISFGTTSPLGQ
jgi:hypothetical protein